MFEQIKRMFVLVDFQVDFVTGTLGFPGADSLDPLLAAKCADGLADEHCVVVVTFDSHEKDYLSTREGRALPVLHAQINTPGWQLFGETGRLINAAAENPAYDGRIVFINKSALGISPENTLKLRETYPEVSEIFVGGLVTNACVIANCCCLQAAWPNAQIIVDARAVNSPGKALHQEALDLLGRMCKVTHMPLYMVAYTDKSGQREETAQNGAGACNFRVSEALPYLEALVAAGRICGEGNTNVRILPASDGGAEPVKFLSVEEACRQAIQILS